MKKLLILIITFALMIASANAADFYNVFKVNYEDEISPSVFVKGFECTNVDCSEVNSNEVEIYNGNLGYQCWVDYYEDNNVNQIVSCLENAKLDSNIHPTLNNGDLIMIKTTIPSSFGYVLHVSPEGDNYVPYHIELSEYSCDFGSCLNSEIFDINFAKMPEVIAEIGQLNIINTEDQKNPIQVEVPVEIEKTVCSAYRYTDSNLWKPSFPNGYSDYSALTQVRVDITNDNTNEEYFSSALDLSIEADKCSTIAAFAWTPDEDLLGERIKFRAETEVIDNQVKNSLIDFIEVYETVFPEDLTNACYTTTFDFTLSNEATVDLTTNLAQITKGETLFALFEGGAFKGEDNTPIDFKADLYFDGDLVHSKTLNSGNNLQVYYEELTNVIQGLDAGAYEVKLVTTPIDDGTCDILENDVQIQNLNLLDVEQFKVKFVITGENNSRIEGADINLLLEESHDNFVNSPIYDESLTTNSNGIAKFENVFRGDYKYTVTADGYNVVMNDRVIGADTTIYVPLSKSNSKPVIDLPEELSIYFEESIELDIENYVSDFNDDFEELTITYEILSGNVNVDEAGSVYTFTTSTPNTAEVEFTVMDSFGEKDSDIIRLVFTDNEAPVIVEFRANPDNGDAPFYTQFILNIVDSDNQDLYCELDFGDGEIFTISGCDNLDTIEHTYENIGTYNAKLTVNDGVNADVVVYEEIMVFETVDDMPFINSLTVDSSNGNFVPTDLEIRWSASHEDPNIAISCELIVNGVSEEVSCNDEKEINAYDIVGEAVFTLVVRDTNGNEVIRTITRNFEREVIVGPTDINIEKFDLTSLNGNFVPTTLSFNIDVSTTGSDPLTCELFVNSGSAIPVTCNGVHNFGNYDYEGNVVFTLRATDGTEVDVETITRTFTREDTEVKNPLNDSNFELEIDSVIAPGDFDFTIRTNNDNLKKRTVFVEPKIICNEATHGLRGAGALATALVSSKYKSDFAFELETNTYDFIGTIPRDVVCIFQVRLFDNYGTDVTLSKTVTFSELEEELQTKSIRGKGSDIVNYMSSALSGNIIRGYNSIEFHVENNEARNKELQITMISKELGISYGASENLKADEIETIQIPIYIKENVKSGLYPIKISVNDGFDKQSRYAYLKIE